VHCGGYAFNDAARTLTAPIGWTPWCCKTLAQRGTWPARAIQTIKANSLLECAISSGSKQFDSDPSLCAHFSPESYSFMNPNSTDEARTCGDKLAMTMWPRRCLRLSVLLHGDVVCISIALPGTQVLTACTSTPHIALYQMLAGIYYHVLV
jgi:hypothetical protein